MDVDDALAVADTMTAQHSYTHQAARKLAEGIRLARQVAEMSGGPYALEALLDLREWFGMEGEVASATEVEGG